MGGAAALAAPLPDRTPPAAARALHAETPGIDSPALAAPGPYPVGVRTLTIAARDPAGHPRALEVDLWYPAARAGRPVRYSLALPAETPGAWVRFSLPGRASRDAPMAKGRPRPLVIVSHGYSGDPDAMSWLTENLASKGYLVAGPRHADPPITDGARFAQVAAQRPLDIAAVLQAFQARRGEVDSKRVALIGYSMGGYGALTVAGAGLAPGFAALLPGRGHGQPAPVEGLRAVVAISPAGVAFHAWAAQDLARLKLPLLLLVGDQDRVVGYAPGVRSIFDQAVNAPRDLLVFEGAGHSIGMVGAPPAMRRRLWDIDWFEDPVWRKARIEAVSLHFITAFLGLNLRGEADKATFLDLTPRSGDDLWPAGSAYDAISPGPPTASVWKGFQRRHTAGLLFERRMPAPSH